MLKRNYVASFFFLVGSCIASSRTPVDHIMQFGFDKGISFTARAIDGAPDDRFIDFVMADTKGGSHSFSVNTWLYGWNGGFERHFAQLTHRTSAMAGEEWNSLMALKKEMGSHKTGYDADLMDRFSYYLRDHSYSVRVRRVDSHMVIYRIGDSFPVYDALEIEELAKGQDFNSALQLLLGDTYSGAELQHNRGGLKDKLMLKWRRQTK